MSSKAGKLETGLLQAMQAIDNQIARALQRTPAEREVHGVQKWGAYETRIEDMTAFLLNALGDEEVGLDALIVFAQAFPKALRLATEDLGAEGLGKIRASYVLDSFQRIEDDAVKGRNQLRGPELS